MRPPELKEILTEAAKKNQADGLLLSGGLDSSILAFLSPGIKAITISLWPFGEDVQYAKLLEKSLNLKLYHRIVGIEEALGAIPEVIRILRSFDPAIPNDLVVYFGLKYAQELGLKNVMTGDGADELFGGYEFMRKIKDLSSYIKKIVKFMSFSSEILGKVFRIQISQPYLDKKVVDFSLKIPAELKIREEKNSVFGKWILRKSFEPDLAEGIIWQNKRPLEYGSGMKRIRELISTKIPDKEFDKAKEWGVKFMNKEHYYYYKVYTEVIGGIPQPEGNQKACKYCRGAMEKEAFHCKHCGWVNKDCYNGKN
ncbi:MAG: hypothetical protein JSV34_04915 [Candidatus Omnitrophota bacterium]|nr:MAG: hypothetical protein JSV34_04915 [Candidatus Omnitrophota bacterium]